MYLKTSQLFCSLKSLFGTDVPILEKEVSLFMLEVTQFSTWRHTILRPYVTDFDFDQLRVSLQFQYYHSSTFSVL